MAEWEVVGEEPLEAGPAAEPTAAGEQSQFESVSEEPIKRTFMGRLTGSDGGERYQTFPERAVREVLGDIRATVQPIMAAPFTREASEAAAGPSLKAALATSPISAASKATKIAPTVSELKRGAKAGYAALKESEIELNPLAVSNFKSQVVDDLIEQGFRDYTGSSPGTFRIVEELAQPTGSRAKDITGSGNITSSDIEAVRQALGKMGSPGTPERAAAERAVDSIDAYLMNLPDIPGLAKDARANWAAAIRGQVIETAIDRGVERAYTSGTGGNIQNTIRQEFRRIKNNPKLFGRFSDEEKDWIMRLEKGDFSDNVLRWLSRFSPRNVMLGMGSAGLLGMTGNVPAAIASATIGEGAFQLGKASTIGKARQLENATRGRSPLGGGAQPLKDSAAKAFADRHKRMRALGMGHMPSSAFDVDFEQPVVDPSQFAVGPVEKPPVDGARKAPDGKWYVPSKDRPGKYDLVETVH